MLVSQQSSTLPSHHQPERRPLRQESEMVRLLVEGSDLHRITTTRSAKVQKSLVSLWNKYEARECTTSEFLAKVGQAYGVVLD